MKTDNLHTQNLPNLKQAPLTCRLLNILCLMTTLMFSTMLSASKSSDAIEILLARTLSPTPIISDLKELTNTIGGRPTGSIAMQKAVDWGLKHFLNADLENVHAEAYTPDINWLPGIEQGELIVPDTSTKEPLRIASMPFSQNSSADGLEAEVYNIGSGSKLEFIAAGHEVRGRWLLVTTHLSQTEDDLHNEYAIKPSIVAQAKKSGAMGLLWISSRSGRLLYRHNLTFNGRVGPIPAAVIERKAGQRIVRLLKTGHTVRVKLTLNNEIQKNPTNYNVVAEIKGWEKPEEVVLLGAHLDSWDLGHGALDNGCNAALVIDAARQIMTLAKEGNRPRRTIRFVLYSGEELGLYGSQFDAHNHQDELEHLKVVVIYDLGSGKTTGFSLAGRHDMKDFIHDTLAPITQFGPFTQTFAAGADTDNFDYLLEGIPTLVADQDPSPYIASYHAESDTFEQVDQHELKNNTAIAAILLWNLANNKKTFPPRQSREEVIAMLKTTGLDKEMKQIKIWDDFVAGRRGRL